MTRRKSSSSSAEWQRTLTERRKAAGQTKLQIWVPSARLPAIKSTIASLVRGENLPVPEDVRAIERDLETERAARQGDIAAHRAALSAMDETHKVALAEISADHENEMNVLRSEIKVLSTRVATTQEYLNSARSALLNPRIISVWWRYGAPTLLVVLTLMLIGAATAPSLLPGGVIPDIAYLFEVFVRGILVILSPLRWII